VTNGTVVTCWNCGSEFAESRLADVLRRMADEGSDLPGAYRRCEVCGEFANLEGKPPAEMRLAPKPEGGEQ
jgi:hypothetical protein